MKLLATAILVSLLGALPLAAGEPPAVSGDYVEARSNEVYTCGWQGSHPRLAHHARRLSRHAAGGREGGGSGGG
jgi:hypothetical protein